MGDRMSRYEAADLAVHHARRAGLALTPTDGGSPRPAMATAHAQTALAWAAIADLGWYLPASPDPQRPAGARVEINYEARHA